VLLIDDEPQISRFATRALELSGYHVRVAHTGTAGLAAARAERPDCVLLDVQLDDMSGLEVMQHLRDDAALATCPVLLWSARTDSCWQRRGRALGAAACLRKPVGAGALIAVVAHLLA
jgi:DNA-binding response OmpR family regulator